MLRLASILSTFLVLSAGAAAAHPGHAVVVPEPGLAHWLFEPMHAAGLLIATVAAASTVALARHWRRGADVRTR